jgi:hypothetical protein
MAYVTRLAGAILASSEGEYFLVGDLKTPCDFDAAGFQSPGELDVKERPFIRLTATAGPRLPQEPVLLMDLEGEALAQKLADCFIIKRNGSISDRLWRLVMESSKTTSLGELPAVDGRWLAGTPDEVWEAVRDSVLRC